MRGRPFVNSRVPSVDGPRRQNTEVLYAFSYHPPQPHPGDRPGVDAQRPAQLELEAQELEVQELQVPQELEALGPE